MKKLILLLSVLVLVGCKETEENAKPSIEGVNGIECIANSTVDLLNGVVAYDKEDGDITPKMDINITPYVKVEDGYAIFDVAGNYKITYSVSDNDGNKTVVNSDISVVERETYISFAEISGFYVEVGGHATLLKGGLYNGKYLIEAKDAEIAEDITLNRVYNLNKNSNYTFKYILNTKHSGRIRVLIDGELYDEKVLSVGENEITFTYNTLEKSSFTLAILLGDLGEELSCELLEATCEYPQQEGLVELLESFQLEGRFHSDGSVSAQGYVEPSQNKVVVTNPGDAMWQAGMFVDTNVVMELGYTYEVSFDVIRTQLNECEISLQNKQWDEKKYDTVFVNSGERRSSHTISITVTKENVGELWLYVQSGLYENEITIVNLSVQTFVSGNKVETIMLEDFTNSNDGFNCELNTFPGGFSYFIETFGEIDYQQKVTSPKFTITGSGKNYIISFKAKASKPTEVVFAAPVAGGWDPTWLWTKFTITEEERIYTFVGGDSVSEQGNVFVWQFGSNANKKYSNVTIEISDIQIHYKNSEYDGD